MVWCLVKHRDNFTLLYRRWTWTSLIHSWAGVEWVKSKVVPVLKQASCHAPRHEYVSIAQTQDVLEEWRYRSKHS
jgi:hypothetical protein